MSKKLDIQGIGKEMDDELKSMRMFNPTQAQYTTPSPTQEDVPLSPENADIPLVSSNPSQLPKLVANQAENKPTKTNKNQQKKTSNITQQQENINTSKEVRKFTSKLVNSFDDPANNKVGFYFTNDEIDSLDRLATTLKPIVRRRTNKRVTKNEIIRACLSLGLENWEEKKENSELLNLLTDKEV